MKRIYIIFSLLVFSTICRSQNLIGGTIEEVKRTLLPTPWVLTTESLTNDYKHYLGYISSANNYSQAYYFDENKVCNEYRIISKMTNVIKFIESVDSVFVKTSKNTWISREGHMNVELKIDNERNVFTIYFYKKED